eukprot:gene12893-biopygen3999
MGHWSSSWAPAGGPDGPVPCHGHCSGRVEAKGQTAVAEFLIETQCALVEAVGKETKILVDSATALACKQMRGGFASLQEEQLCALGQLSVSSAEACTVLAGQAGKALRTKCISTTDLAACLPAVRHAEAGVLWPCRGDGETLQRPSIREWLIVAVSAGGAFGVAIRSEDGTLVAWGDDEFKQISDLPSGSDFVEVSAGHSFAGGPLQHYLPCKCIVRPCNHHPHTVARKADGSLVAWGDNSGGEAKWELGSYQIGGADHTPSGTGHARVAAGGNHAIAIRGDAPLVSWGWDECDINKCVTHTPSGTGFKQVAAGSGHSVALKKDGSLVSWGNDDMVEQVSGTPAGTGFCAIAVAAGGDMSIALKQDGSLVSWGSDEFNHEVSKTPSAGRLLAGFWSGV